MIAEQKAAFINAQVEMMRAERAVMEAENDERARQGCSPANGPEQWADFIKRWLPVLGYNAVLSFYQS